MKIQPTIYRARAFNSVGNSAYSNVAEATTPQSVPIAPANLECITVSSSQIDLDWTDFSFNEYGFIVERKTGAGGAFATIDSVGEGVVCYSDTGLTEMITYFYRVCAFNSAGNSEYSNTTNATTSNYQLYTIIGSYSFGGYATSVAISDTFAYVTDQYNGLRIIDVSDPSNPNEIGYCSTPNRDYAVATAGDYAFVAAYMSGLQIINVSDPTNPVEISLYDLFSSHSVTVSGDYVYVGDAYWGLMAAVIYGWSVQQTSDGGYIITGRTESYAVNWADVYLIKTDANGNEQWNQTIGGSSLDFGVSVQQTLNGGYIIAGTTSSYSAGATDVYLIKTVPNP